MVENEEIIISGPHLIRGMWGDGDNSFMRNWDLYPFPVCLSVCLNDWLLSSLSSKNCQEIPVALLKKSNHIAKILGFGILI